MRMKSDKIPFLIGIIITAVFVIGNVAVAATYNNRTVDIEKSTGQEEVVTERTVTEIRKETIQFETKTVNDDTVEYGKTIVKTEGINGEKTYTYNVTYMGEKEISRELVEEEITKQPVAKVIVNGTKIVWHCKDTTSYDGYSGNDNLCTSSTGEQRYVGDCAAVALDHSYHPSQRGASYYNGCPNY